MMRFLASSALMAVASASFCGDSTIPFSLEVLPDGQPLLGCARPTCFGWASNGTRATNSAYFEQVNGVADGFVRIGRDSIPAYGHEDARYFLPQTAICEPYFQSGKCAKEDQWVGGIRPLSTLTAHLNLRCCAFEALFESEDRGIATVNNGQIVTGGEVMNSGIQAGFDYISDIAKNVLPDGSAQYSVSIRRMRCPALRKDSGSHGGYNAESGNALAFQAPNVAVNQPLPLPPSPIANSAVEQVSNSQASQNFQGSPFNQQQAVSQQYGPQQPPTQYQQAPAQYQQPSQASSCQANANPMYYSAVSFGCGGQFCFSGDMLVEVVDGTMKRMDQLTKTDWVLSLSKKELVYEPVEFWLHRVPSQEAEFNVFETEDGKTIKLTDKHFIFKGDCSQLSSGPVNISALPQEAVTADQVQAGDCLYSMDKDRNMREVLVVRSSKVTETGIYAPMTNSGRIIVNGVHASCHNIMQEHTTGHALFQYVTMANQWYESIFGADPDEVVETPTGLSTILAMADLIIPKSIGSM